MTWGPKKFLGIWFSAKPDRTLVDHAVVTAAGCLLHPLLPIVFYFSKELREGTGYDFKSLSEDCVGWGKCLQGFGIDDFGIVLAVAVPYWLWLPSLLQLIWSRI